MSFASMTHRERVQATWRGEPVDRAPITFWFHFPERDRTPAGLAEATLEFYRRYDLDLIKLMPTGTYATIDYGATVSLQPDLIGTTQVVESPVRTPADWGRLRAVSPARGELAAQVETVRRVRAALGPDAPIIETIFSPLTTANKLAGPRFAEHVKTASDQLEIGLARLASDTIAFGRACLDAGADGFFFACQHANRQVELSDETFERLGATYDLQVLEGLQDPRNWCTVLHLHGNRPRFELADRYAIAAVNWHDRETEPSIREALQRTRRGLAAGLVRGRAGGEAQTLVAQVHDALAQAQGRRLMIAPGCVLPSQLPEAVLRAIRQAVE